MKIIIKIIINDTKDCGSVPPTQTPLIRQEIDANNNKNNYINDKEHCGQHCGFIPLKFDVLKLLENTLNIESKNDDYEQTQYILEIINQIACDKPLIFNDNNSINNLNIKSPLI